MTIVTMCPQAKGESFPSGFPNNNGEVNTTPTDVPKRKRQPVSSATKHRDSEAMPSKKKVRVGKKSDEVSCDLPSTENEDVTTENKTCPKCKKSFRTDHDFTVHIKTHNTEDRVCGICGKVLSSPSSRDRHMLTHSGERPFVCKLCNSNFTTNGNMHRHMKTHQEASCDSLLGEHGDGGAANDKTGDSDKQSSSFHFEQELCNLDETPSDAPVPQEQPADEVVGFEIPDTDVEMSEDAEKTPNRSSSDGEVGLPRCANASRKRKVVGFHDLREHEISGVNFPVIATAANEAVTRMPCNESHDYTCDKCNNAFPSQSALRYHHTERVCRECSCYFTTEFQHKLHSLKCHDHGTAEPTATQEDVDRSDTAKSIFCNRLGLCRSIYLKELYGHEHFKQSETQPKNVHLPVTLLQSFNQHKDISLDKSVFNGSIDEEAVDKQPEDLDYKGSASNSLGSGNDFASINAILNTVKAMPVRNTSAENEVSCNTSENISAELKPSENSKKYTCETCSYGSNDKSSFNRHVETHSSSNRYTCIICATTFTNRSNGERHVRIKHKVKDLSRVSKAIRSRPNGEQKCRYCKKSFESSQALSHHIRSQNDSCKKKPYMCKICCAFASTKNNIVRHVTKQHSDRIKGKTEREKKSNANDLIETSPSLMFLHDEEHSDSKSLRSSPLTLIDNSSSSESEPSEEAEAAIEDNRQSMDSSLQSEDDRNGEKTIPQSLTFPAYNVVHSTLNEGVAADDGMQSLAQVCCEAPRLSLDEPLDLSVRAMDLSSNNKISNMNHMQYTPRLYFPAANSLTGSQPENLVIRRHGSLEGFQVQGTPYAQGITKPATPSNTHAQSATKSLHKTWKNRVAKHKPYNLGNGHHFAPSYAKHRLESANRRSLQNKDNRQAFGGVGKCFRQLSKENSSDEREVSSDLENVDLASVPSVINTANSSKIGSFLSVNRFDHTLAMSLPAKNELGVFRSFAFNRKGPISSVAC